MKKHLLKSLLVGLMALAATSAWAADKTVVKYSFDDAMSPSLTAGSRVSFDYDKTSVITSTKFLNAYNNANGDPGSSTVSLGSTDLSAETWTLSFEWAACGGCNSKADHTILKAGDTNLFDLTGNSNWNTTVTITYSGSDGTKTLPVPGCDKGKRFTAATGDQLNTTAYWHHVVVTGSSDGVKMTITNSNSGTAVVEDVVLSATNVNPTSLIIEPCCGGAIGIDELSLTYSVEGEVVQTPVANYSAVDGINRTITATCDTEGATLYYSTDGESWTEGASVTVSESGKVYFKAVKGTTESDVLEFDAEAGEAIVLNAPVINRTSNTSVTISCDQTGLLLSPTATVYYTYGEEKGSFTGSITLTVAADATITAYAEAEGYTTSETSERAVALFPTFVETLESIDAKTSGWSENAFSTETITASERTYAALMLDGVQWGQNVYLQTGGAWGLRASGNWYINSATDESWLLMQNMKKGDIVVVNVTYPASSMVNATFSKYTYGTRQAYEVTEDGDVELAFKKPNASDMDYLYGVYAYREVEVTPKNIYLDPAIWDVEDATERYAAYAFNSSSVYEWYDFAAAGEEGIFTAAVPDFYKNIILVRMNGETTENNWDNKWNQTADIDFTAYADSTLFTITGWETTDFETSKYEVSVPGMNTYTATFTTNAGWGEVYAYAWTTEGENTTEFLGAWPGTKLEDNEGVYTATIEAAAAPAYIIFNNGGMAKTADLPFEDGKAYEFTISDEWAAAIAAAAAEAEEDGVAVGKLIEAIAKAQGQTGTDEEKAALQAAVDQYKADNAPQETDLTSQFSALTDWQKWTGATGYTATNFCPTVDINDGTKKQVCEKYETTCATTGDIFYQTVTGLTTGTYKIELYGGAAFTFGRGFGSMAFTGEIGTGDAWGTHNSDTYTAGQHIDTETGVKMYAITSEGTYEEEIPIYYATNFPDGAATVVLDGVKVGVNGEVKIGMNKTSQSTNWHVVQLKGVTAQVLAKDLYAAHQTELKALLVEAKALLADENKTNLKDGFEFVVNTAEQGVDSKMINITELEALIGNLKTGIADFKKANYFIDFAAGEYYIIDAETDLKMAAGNNYGTRGIVNELGLDLTLTPYTESRTVTIDSRVSNGGDNHFLGQNLYMDSSEWGWALEYRGFGFYILDPNTQKYINIDENNNLVLSETPREFIIVSKEGVYEQRMGELEDATATNPVDATFLLQNPNFNRNDQRVSAWVVTFTEGNNSNLNGGNQVNNCGESYHAAFNVMQTVEGAPKGMYELTAQGFYRQDDIAEGQEAPAAPVFFANGVNKDVPVRTGSEDSMSAASESFSNGLYTIEPIQFDVTDEGEDSGKIYVGVTTAVTNQWVIFDNFRLLYYGKDTTTGISELTANGQNAAAAAEGIYNLQGQRVEKAKKGLYIINGKKVVRK